MRLLFVFNNVLEAGGVGTWIRACVRSLPNLGEEGWILETQPSNPLSRDVEKSIMDRHRVLTRKPSETLAARHRRWQKVIQEINPDVLVFNETHMARELLEVTNGEYAAINVMHSDRKEGRGYAEATELIKAGVVTLGVSREIVRELKSRVKAEHFSRISHYLLGVSGDETASPRNLRRDCPLRILYAGRLIQYQKHILDLPRLMELVVNGGIDAHLNVVGGGPEEEALRSLLQASPVQERVTIHGQKSHEETLQWMTKSDLFLLISDFEGLPLAMLEAMARGCVPLTPDLASGIDEVLVNGRNGLLYRPGDYDHAVDQLKKLVVNGNTFSRLSSEAIRTAGKYQFSEQLPELLKHGASAELHHPVLKQWVDSQKNEDQTLGHRIRNIAPRRLQYIWDHERDKIWVSLRKHFRKT